MSESATVQGNVTVNAPTLHATFSGFTAYVGSPYAGTVATFTDDAPDFTLTDYSATINWGDGNITVAKVTAANSSGQSYIVTDPTGHTYKTATIDEDPYVVTVTVAKSTTGSQGGLLIETAKVMGNVPVALPTLHVAVTPFPAVAGTAYSGQVATFTEDQPFTVLENNPNGNPNNFYTAVIQWGDGAMTNGKIVQTSSAATSFSVQGTHAYKASTVGAAPEVVNVSISEVGNNEQAQGFGNVPVADALLAPFNQGLTFQANEGAVFTGVVAQFTTGNPFLTAAAFNGAFAPVISWGDGKTSLGRVVANGASFNVIGSHTYTAPTPAGLADTISVAVTDAGGARTTVTNNMVVSPSLIIFTNLTLPTTPGIPIVEGKAFTSDVVEFQSVNAAAVAGQFTASINWGDGSILDAGAIRLDGNGLFHVSGTHTYAKAGVYSIVTTIQIIGGAVTSPTTRARSPSATPRLRIHHRPRPSPRTRRERH